MGKLPRWMKLEQKPSWDEKGEMYFRCRIRAWHPSFWLFCLIQVYKMCTSLRWKEYNDDV
jgi:hypothetical protein